MAEYEKKLALNTTQNTQRRAHSSFRISAQSSFQNLLERAICSNLSSPFPQHRVLSPSPPHECLGYFRKLLLCLPFPNGGPSPCPLPQLSSAWLIFSTPSFSPQCMHATAMGWEDVSSLPCMPTVSVGSGRPSRGCFVTT